MNRVAIVSGYIAVLAMLSGCASSSKPAKEIIDPLKTSYMDMTEYVNYAFNQQKDKDGLPFLRYESYRLRNTGNAGYVDTKSLRTGKYKVEEDLDGVLGVLKEKCMIEGGKWTVGPFYDPHGRIHNSHKKIAENVYQAYERGKRTVYQHIGSIERSQTFYCVKNNKIVYDFKYFFYFKPGTGKYVIRNLGDITDRVGVLLLNGNIARNVDLSEIRKKEATEKKKQEEENKIAEANRERELVERKRRYDNNIKELKSRSGSHQAIFALGANQKNCVWACETYNLVMNGYPRLQDALNDGWSVELKLQEVPSFYIHEAVGNKKFESGNLFINLDCKCSGVSVIIKK